MGFEEKKEEYKFSTLRIRDEFVKEFNRALEIDKLKRCNK